MRIFLSLIAIAVTSLLTLLPTIAAADEVAFDKGQFEKLIAEGKPVIVDFYAEWCPTCKTQKASVEALAADPKLKDVTIFIADFDNEKDLRKALRVSSQSTFVVFKGGREVARSTGQTKKEAIAATFAKAL